MSEPREMTPEEWATASRYSLNDIVTFTKLNGSCYQLRGRTTPEGWPFAMIVSVASPGNEPALELVRKLHDDLVRLGAPLRGYAQNPNEADPYGEPK